MYFQLIFFFFERIFLFFKWRIKVKIAVAHMLASEIAEAIYAFFMLQYRRPRSVMQIANGFVSHKHFDKTLKKMFFKEVYKTKIFADIISIGAFVFFFLVALAVICLGIKERDTLSIVGGIALCIFLLSIVVGMICDCNAKRKKMKIEMEKYYKFPF